MKKFLLAAAVLYSTFLYSQKDTAAILQNANTQPGKTDTVVTATPAEPFAWGDFTWMNGTDRQKSALLDSKYFTGTFTVDVNYTQSNHHPIDNTVVGSTALARDREFTVSFLGFGGDFHWNNVRGRV